MLCLQPYVLQRQWEGYSQASSNVTVWDTGVPVDLLKFIGTASVNVPKHMVCCVSNCLLVGLIFYILLNTKFIWR